MLLVKVVIGPAGSRAMGYVILGPGPVLNVHACPLPIYTSWWTNIHVVSVMIPITKSY